MSKARDLADFVSAGNPLADGTISASEVSGLGTAATTASTDYATAAQGSLADSAVQPNDSPSFAGLTVDTNTLFVDAASNKVGMGTSTPAATLDVAGTGAIKVPVGTTAERPTEATGLLRFNSTDGSFEGYNGTEWGAIGGGGSTEGPFLPNAGTAAAPAYSTVADTDTGFYFPAANELALTLSGAEKARFRGSDLLLGSTSSVGNARTAGTLVVAGGFRTEEASVMADSGVTYNMIDLAQPRTYLVKVWCINIFSAANIEKEEVALVLTAQGLATTKITTLIGGSSVTIGTTAVGSVPWLTLTQTTGVTDFYVMYVTGFG